MPSSDVSAAHTVPLPGARPGRDPSRAIKRGPRRIPAEAVAATQRDRLFDGLVHTVARKGYANATVTDICMAAGVTRPAFYALFEGKDNAFLCTYRHGTGVLLQMMEQAYHGAPDWRRGQRAALSVLLEVLAAVPAFATMAIVEIDSVGPAARRERDQVLRRFHQFFNEVPEEARSAVPGELVDTIVGGVYHTIHTYVAEGRVAELPELLPTLTYFVLVPFLGREEAARELRSRPPAGAATVPPCAATEPARRSADRRLLGGEERPGLDHVVTPR